MRRRMLGPLGVATSLVAGFGLFAGAAFASPTIPSDDDIASVDAAADETAARITALEAELATNQAAYDAAEIAAAVAAERYNEAAVALEDAQAEQDAAESAAADAQRELDDASAALADLAMASYRSGGELAQLGSLLSADGLEDALAQAATFQVLGTSAADAEQRYTDAEVAADAANERAAAAVEARAEAAAELQAASEAADAAAAQAADILTANQTRHAELVAELADLRQTSVEMEEARQQAAEQERLAQENAAAAQALGVEEPAATSDDVAAAPADEPSQAEPTQAAPTQAEPSQDPTTREPTPDPTTPAPTSPAPTTPAPTTAKPAPTTAPPAPPSPAPPSSSANLAALAWAKTQIGKPYVYGAAGPNAYDCSGLTMRAYQHAGITIARTSAGQYYSGDLVPISEMQPGDLFFYSDNGQPSGIYHVAIYAGNGMRVHAPMPGKTVELVPMWWPNVLGYAVRP